ncbi:MAG: Ig-like domain repeat protein, partial [Acidobacteriaceae bacterium]|nr:Ig-like domain repeat protein [Acidobacteriaceae bacterium]
MVSAFLFVLFGAASAGPSAAQTQPSVTGTVAVGAGQASGACNLVTNKCYFPSYGKASVTVVDGSTGQGSTVSGSFATVPNGVAIDLALNKIYVASSTDGTLYVIDGTNDSLNTTLTLASTSGLGLPAVDPVTHYVYVPDKGNGGLLAVDGSTITSSGSGPITSMSVSAGPGSFGAAVNPVTHKVYMSNPAGGIVSVFDGYGAQSPGSAVSHDVDITLLSPNVANPPFYMGINPVTDTTYVTAGSFLVAINGSEYTIQVSDNLGPSIAGIAVDPVTNNIFVGGARLYVFYGSPSNADTVSTVAAFFPAVNPATGQVYAVGYTGSNNVYVYDEVTAQLTTLSPGQATPVGVAVNPVTNTAFIANQGSNNVTMVGGNQNMPVPGTPVTGTNSVVLEPYNPQTSMDNGYVYAQSGGTSGIAGAYLYAIGLPAAPGASIGSLTSIQLGAPYSTAGNVCRPISTRINPSIHRAYFRISCSSGSAADAVGYVDTTTNQWGAAVYVAPVIASKQMKVCGLEINPARDTIFALLKDVCTAGSATAAYMVTIQGGTWTAGAPVSLGTNATNAFGVDQASNKVFVGEYVSSPQSSSVEVLDGATGQIVQTVTLGQPGAFNNSTAASGATLPRVQVNPYSHNAYVSFANTTNSNRIQIITNDPVNGYTSLVNPVLMQATANTSPASFFIFDPNGMVYAEQAANNTVIPFSEKTALSTSAVITPSPAWPAMNNGGSGCSDPISHKVYIPLSGGTTVRIIDAVTNTVLGTSLTVGSAGKNCNLTPDGNYLVVGSAGSSSVYFFDLRRNQPVPLTVDSIEGISDSWTQATSSVSGEAYGNYFVTQNQTPSFTVTASSHYSTSPALSGASGVNDPKPTKIYFTADGLTPMQSATPDESVGTPSNEASFTATLPRMHTGIHYLDVYAAYGDESKVHENSSSPQLSLIAAYQFMIQSTPTKTVLAPSENPSIVGDSVTLTAIVTPALEPQPNGFDITGQVSFYEGTTLLGSAQVVKQADDTYTAQITIPTAMTTAGLSGQVGLAGLGIHNLSATYYGDASYSESTGSLAESVQAQTATALTSVPSSSQVAGNNVTFTAVVEPVQTGGPALSGTVNFYNGSTLLGSGALSLVGGVYQATYSTSSLAVGDHPAITATYLGDGTYYETSTSNNLGLTIFDSNVTVTVQSTPNPSAASQSVTYTATVSSTEATGTMVFTAVPAGGGAAIALGSDAVTSGVAQISSSALTVLGAYTVTAAYTSDNGYLPNSGTMTQIVTDALCGANGFGEVAVGQKLVCAVRVQLSDGGLGTSLSVVTMGAPSLDFNATTPADSAAPGYFVLPASLACSPATEYPAGATCWQMVTFAPKSPGLRTGAVVLLDRVQPDDGSGSGGGSTPDNCDDSWDPDCMSSDRPGGAGGDSTFSPGPYATAYIWGTGVAPQIIFLPGKVSTVFSVSQPNGIAVDAQGNIFATDAGASIVYEYRVSDGARLNLADNTNSPAYIYNPEQISIDGAGNLYLVDRVRLHLVKMTRLSDGSYTLPVEIPTSTLSSPMGTAVDTAGNVYVADSGNGRILKETLQPDGSYVETVIADSSTGWLNPMGVAVDTFGNLYVSSTNMGTCWSGPAPGNIYKLTLSGGVYSSPTVIPTSPLTCPFGVTVDAVGNLFIADTRYPSTTGQGSNLGRIVKLALEPGNSYTESTILDDGFAPYNVAVDGQGNIYPADAAGGGAAKLDLATPKAVDFPVTWVGQTSAPESETIQNVGNAPLTINGVHPDGNNPAISPVDFQWATVSTSTPPVCVSGDLAVNVQCNLWFDFTPVVPGPISGTADLSDNNLNQTSPLAVQHIPLNGSAALIKLLSVTPNEVVQGVGTPVTFVAELDYAPSTTGAVYINLTNSSLPAVPPMEALCEPTAVPNVANCTVANWNSGGLVAGVYNVTASTGGVVSTTLPLTLTVDPLSATTTVITSSRNPSLATDTTAPTFTAHVTTPGSYPLTGTVSFSITAPGSGTPTVMCTNVVLASDGTANCTPSSLLTTVGIYTVTATYNGNGSDPLNLSSTADYLQVVNDALCGTNNFGHVSVGQKLVCAVKVSLPGGGQVASIDVLTTGATSLEFNPTDPSADSTAQGYFVMPASLACNTTTNYPDGAICFEQVTFAPKYPGMRLGAVVLSFADTTGTGTGTGGSTPDDCEDSWDPDCMSSDRPGGGGEDSVRAPFEPIYIWGTGVAPLAVFNSPLNQPIALSSGFVSPIATAIDSSGNVYVADAGLGVGGVSGVYEIQGSCISTAPDPSTCPKTTLGAGISSPQAIAVDGAGNVWVQGNTALYKMTPNCADASCVTTVGAFGGMGVAVDGSGNVYVSSGNTLQMIPAGSTSAFPLTGSLPYSPTQGISGVAVDGNGNVYLGATNGNTLAVEVLGSCIANVTSTSGPVDPSCVKTVGNGFTEPTGVAVDAAGNLYVLDYNYTAFPSTTGTVKEILASCISTAADPSTCSSIMLYSGVSHFGMGISLDGIGNIYGAGFLGGTGVVLIDRSVTPGLSFATSPMWVPSTDSPQTAIAQNIGNDTLLLVSEPVASQITAPTTPSSFLLDGSYACGTSVAMGALCYLPVDFKPNAAEIIQGVLTLTDNSLNIANSQQIVPLNGEGIDVTPVITVTEVNPASVIQGRGDMVELTATVDFVLPTAPTGEVNFIIDGQKILASCMPTAGSSTQLTCHTAATYIPSGALPAGIYPVTATIDADSVYNSASTTGTAPTLTVKAPIPPPRLSTNAGVGVNPATDFVYTTNSVNDKVTVLNARTATVSTLDVGSQPYTAAVDPALNKIFVTNTGSDSVSVINGATNTVMATIPLASGAAPKQMAVDAAAGYVYVVNSGTDSISVINAADNSLAVASQPVQMGPDAVAVDPNTHMVFVANASYDTVSVFRGFTGVSGSTLSAAGTVNVGGSPVSVAVNPVTGMAYVANYAGNSVSVISEASPNTVAATIPLGAGANPVSVVVDHMTNTAYVADYGLGKVWVIDGENNTLDPSTPAGIITGTGPIQLETNSLTNEVYVVNTVSRKLSIIDGRTGLVTSPQYMSVIDGTTLTLQPSTTSTLPINSVGVGVDAITNKAYVVSEDGSIAITSGDTNTVIATLSAPVTGMAQYNPVNGEADLYGGASFIAVKGPLQANVKTIPMLPSGETSCSSIGNPKIDILNQRIVFGLRCTVHNYIAYFDMKTDTFGGTLYTFAGSVYAGTLQVNPITGTVVFGSSANTNVYMVDYSGNLLATIPQPTGSGAHIFLNPANNRIYAPSYTTSPASSSVMVIDNGTGSVITTIPLPDGAQPTWVNANNYNNKLYVNSPGNSTVSVFDMTTNALLDSPVSISSPAGMTLFGPNDSVWVTQSTPAAFTVLDGDSNQIVATPTGGGAAGLIDPISANYYYVSGTTLYSIGSATFQPRGTTAVGSTPSIGENYDNSQGTSLDPGCGMLYVANRGSSSISVVHLRNTAVSNVNGTEVTCDNDTIMPFTISHIVGDPTVQITNNPSFPGIPYGIYATQDSAPSFAVTANSDYKDSGLPGYSTGTNPIPTRIYYGVDGRYPYLSAALTSDGSTSPALATATVAVPPQRVGVHTLFIYAAYGDEGSSADYSSTSDLSVVGVMPFAVLSKVPPFTVTASPNPAVVESTVTLTATLAVPHGAFAPTGIINFYNTTGGPVTDSSTPIASGYLSAMSSSDGTTDYYQVVTTVTASPGVLDLGDNQITAVYYGDTSYSKVMATTNEKIIAPGIIISPPGTIDPPAMPTALPNAANGTAYSTALTASDTAFPYANYTWNRIDGGGTCPAGSISGLPPGLSASRGQSMVSGSSGDQMVYNQYVISGTPMALAGIYCFTVTATDDTSSTLGGPYTSNEFSYTITLTGPSIVVTSGGEQTGNFSEALPEPLEVTVYDAAGAVVEGAQVTFTAPVPATDTAGHPLTTPALPYTLRFYTYNANGSIGQIYTGTTLATGFVTETGADGTATASTVQTAETTCQSPVTTSLTAPVEDSFCPMNTNGVPNNVQIGWIATVTGGALNGLTTGLVPVTVYREPAQQFWIAQAQGGTITVTSAQPLNLTQLAISTNIPGDTTYFYDTDPSSAMQTVTLNQTKLAAGQAYNVYAMFQPRRSVNPDSNPNLQVDATSRYDVHYSGATLSVAVPQVTVAAVRLSAGMPLDASQLQGSASVPGTFSYTPAAGTVMTTPGTQTLTATFTPVDTAHNAAVVVTAPLTVSEDGKTTPVITWAVPAAISTGTALGAAQLNATADVPGTFVYSPAAGTVMKTAGTQTLSVTFTPADTANYNTVTKTVPLTVKTLSQPTVTWITPVSVVYGTALSATQLNASSKVAGTFAYTPAAGVVLPAGSNALTAVFTPTDTSTYATVTVTNTLKVTQASSVVTWASPAAITVGTALSSTQLNATANVPGTFAYTPAAGTVMNTVGTQTLSVTFTPEDATDYATATATVSLT